MRALGLWLVLCLELVWLRLELRLLRGEIEDLERAAEAARRADSLDWVDLRADYWLRVDRREQVARRVCRTRARISWAWAEARGAN